ncbi:hypothetical protein JCM19240_1915 [Vibrio maritimus]|uniref:Uncharacterized protein n=1 Tax=Vibrio maritimus TaxID=990268 RepID=A0A090T975_9VIBR|nr:hypothetical protein JCM19240_1915 [Vibrio maritimus]
MASFMLAFFLSVTQPIPKHVINEQQVQITRNLLTFSPLA